MSPGLYFNQQDQVGLCDQQSVRRGLESDLNVVQPESAFVMIVMCVTFVGGLRVRKEDAAVGGGCQVT